MWVRAYIWAVTSLLGGALLGTGCSGASADTLEWALVQAYQNNPSLNAQRAALRATDENVPQALSGYRPKLSVTGNGGYNYTNARRSSSSGGALTNSSIRAEVLFAHLRRHGNVRRCSTAFRPPTGPGRRKARSMAARETLRVTEQQVLLDAATAYMNLLRDEAILDLNRQQRRSPYRAAQADARPLQCRRGDAHRRRASRIAAGRRPLRTARRAVELRDLAGQLSARDRRRSGQACAGHAG